MTPRIHNLDALMAYDSTQTDEEIQDGDVLVVPSAKMVGVMISAWPTAINASVTRRTTMARGSQSMR